jgi:hypothetical protein
LLQTGVVLVSAIVLAVVFTALVGVFGVIVAVLVGASHSFSGAAVFALLIGGLVLAGVGLVYSAIVLLWQTIVWTLFWRKVTGVESRIDRRSADSPTVSSDNRRPRIETEPGHRVW